MGFNIKQTLRSSIKSSILVLKLIIPLYILSDILLYFGVLEYISFIFKPITNALSLPQEASLSIGAGIFINIYAAIAFGAPLGLSSYQWTIMGIFIGVCHSLIIEGAIMKKLQIPYLYSVLLRFTMGFICVIPLYFMPKNWFDNSTSFEPEEKKVYDGLLFLLEDSLWQAFLLSIKVIVLIVGIIFLMDFIKSRQIVQKYQQKVSTLFSIIVGLLLGITYGAGILINEAQGSSLSHKDIFFIGTFLMICHSLIEDTLLFVIVGGNFWAIAIIRIVFATLFSYIIIKYFYKFFYSAH